MIRLLPITQTRLSITPSDTLFDDPGKWKLTTADTFSITKIWNDSNFENFTSCGIEVKYYVQVYNLMKKR